MLKLTLSLVVVATATVAHADPDPTPTSELSAGASIGFKEGFEADARVDGEHQLHGPWWLHGMVAVGDAHSFDWNGPPDEMNYPGHEVMVRAGLESRACATDAVCAFAGLDLGYRDLAFTEDTAHSRPEQGAIVAPRIGLDYGTRHVRLRPGIDAIVGRDGYQGLELTGAVAYRW